MDNEQKEEVEVQIEEPRLSKEDVEGIVKNQLDDFLKKYLKQATPKKEESVIIKNKVKKLGF